MSQRERENNGDGGRGETTKKHKLSRRWQREQVKSNRSPRVWARQRERITCAPLKRHKQKGRADLDETKKDIK